MNMSWSLLVLGEALECSSLYLNGKLDGYLCADNSTLADLVGVVRSQCFLSCMGNIDCMIIAYNEKEKQCKMFSKRCGEARQYGDFAIFALGPPRADDIKWRTNSVHWPPNVVVVNGVGGSGMGVCKHTTLWTIVSCFVLKRDAHNFQIDLATIYSLQEHAHTNIQTCTPRKSPHIKTTTYYVWSQQDIYMFNGWSFYVK